MNMLISMVSLLVIGIDASPMEDAPSEIAKGVYLFAGQIGGELQPDGNSLMFKGAHGWVVLDTGRHPVHTERLLDFAKASGEPVVAVINSHWHLDHVSGNRLIREAYPDVTVYASRGMSVALQGRLAPYAGMVRERIAGEEDPARMKELQDELATMEHPDAMLPDVVLDGCDDRDIAGRSFHVCVAEQAVSAADVWLVDKASGVLAAGDLITLPAPLMDTACPEGWARALEAVASSKFQAVVPGHGPVLDHRQVQHYQQAFGKLLACGTDEVNPPDSCIAGWFSDAGDLVPEDSQPYARELLDYYVSQKLRAPAERAELCAGTRG